VVLLLLVVLVVVVFRRMSRPLIDPLGSCSIRWMIIRWLISVG